jgi:hypothetical protein
MFKRMLFIFSMISLSCWATDGEQLDLTPEIQSQDETSDPIKSTIVRELQFDNDSVSVWKSTIPSEAPIQMHRHDSPRVVVPLKDGLLHRIEQNGEISDLIFKAGRAYWIEADPPKVLHADINPSHEPLEVIVIELKPAHSNK